MLAAWRACTHTPGEEMKSKFIALAICLGAGAGITPAQAQEGTPALLVEVADAAEVHRSIPSATSRVDDARLGMDGRAGLATDFTLT